MSACGERGTSRDWCFAVIGFFPPSWSFAFIAMVLGVPLVLLLMLWVAVYVGFLPKPPPKPLVGRCRMCGYDLSGNVSGVCSECGAETGGDRR